MTSYIANHEKKKRRLAKCEAQLRRLIARGVDREELLEAALEVRDARVRALRARQNRNPGVTNRALWQKHEQQVEKLLSISAEAVLAEFAPALQ